jgi:DNA-binding response OmpR family regulator
MAHKRILIIDDDTTILELLKHGLGVLGYDVEVVDNHSDFKISLAQCRPDLILMDVSMPGMDGISLCREIRFAPTNNDIPIIIITAFNDDKTYHDAILFGATDFITKPFEIQDVQKKIEAAFLKAESKKQK